MSTSPKLSLGHSWMLWFDRGGQRGQTQAEYEQGITEVGLISTVEDFWRYWSPLIPNSPTETSLPERCNLLLFKHGIKPKWEDPENINGGRFTVTVSKNVGETVATNIVLELIGEQFPLSESICGVVIRMRSQAYTIDVWNKNNNNPPTIILDHLTKLLESLNLSTTVLQAIQATLKYQLHKDSNATPRLRLISSDSPKFQPLDSASSQQQPAQSTSIQNKRNTRSTSQSPRTVPQPPPSPSQHHINHQQQQSQTNLSRSIASPSPSRKGTEFVIDRLEALDDPTKQQPQQQPSIQQLQPQTLSIHVRAKSKDDTHVSASATLPSEIQQKQQSQKQQPSSTSTTTTTQTQPTTPKMPKSSATQQWLRHKKSASEDVGAQRAQRNGQLRISSGIEQALPVLLRQGFDVPAAAYVELAQIKMHSDTPPDSPRALKCRQLLRGGSNGGSSGFVLSNEYMQHRRAYSLDRSADDLTRSYETYSRAKQEAFSLDLASKNLPPPSTTSTTTNSQISVQQSNVPIPGVTIGTPAIPGIVFNEQCSPVSLQIQPKNQQQQQQQQQQQKQQQQQQQISESTQTNTSSNSSSSSVSPTLTTATIATNPKTAHRRHKKGASSSPNDIQQAGVQRSALSCESTESTGAVLNDPAIIATSKDQIHPNALTPSQIPSAEQESDKNQRQEGFFSSPIGILAGIITVFLASVIIPFTMLHLRNM